MKKDTNVLELTGKVVSGFEYNHTVLGEDFYLIRISVERKSEVADIIPVMVSSRLIKVEQDLREKFVEIVGSFRSCNQDGHLNLFAFADEIEILEEAAECKNRISLQGFICKPNVYRKTPLGREIADMLIAVNRTYGKSDYIPCISWGRNARYAERALQVGDKLELTGRLQSRTYLKKKSETESEERIAYEVSISRITKLSEGGVVDAR